MKKCYKCEEEKNENEFGKLSKSADGLRNTCKSCRRIPKELHKPNAGRFRKGYQGGKQFHSQQVPWNKGTKGLQTAWNKGISATEQEAERLRSYNETRSKIAKSRGCKKYFSWRKKVLERDGNKCTECKSTHRLAAHHIVPWEKLEKLRFDVDNGLTLCNSCHAKLEGFQIGHRGIKHGR